MKRSLRITHGLLITIAALLWSLVVSGCKPQKATTANADEQQLELVLLDPEWVWESPKVSSESEQRIEVVLNVYEADDLPAGQFYTRLEQLHNAPCVAQFRIHTEIGKNYCNFDGMDPDPRAAVDVSSYYWASEKALSMDIRISGKELGQFKLEHVFLAKFDEPTLFSVDLDGQKPLVCVYKVRKLKCRASQSVIRKNTPFTKSDNYLPKKASLPSQRYFKNQKALEKLKIEATKVSSRSYVLESLSNLTTSDSCLILNEVELNKIRSRIRADENDIVYNLNDLFGHLISSENQWVYYNATQQRMVANADSYLDASIRHYILKVKDISPTQFRIKADLIEVGKVESEEIANIQKLISDGKASRIASSISVYNGSRGNFIQLPNGDSISCSPNQLYKDEPVDLIFKYKSAEKIFVVSTLIKVNSSAVIPCGINLGQNSIKKAVLLLHIESIDSIGKIVEQRPLRKLYGALQEIDVPKSAFSHYRVNDSILFLIHRELSG